MKRVILSRSNEIHTTARYFENVFRQNQIDYQLASESEDILKLHRDDLFLYIDPSSFVPLHIEKMRCRTSAYFIDVHQGLDERLRLAQLFDTVFIAQRQYLEPFRQVGCPNVYWLPLACDPDVHFQSRQNEIYDVAFVGKLGRTGSWRHETLTKVLCRYKTNNYSAFVIPNEISQIYSQSKIVFNASINHELNMRFFEAMAAGALLVTDRIPEELGEMFIEGEHFVGYTTVAEAIEKIDYFLVHDSERKQIASCGQQQVLAHHTYKKRWDDLVHTYSCVGKNAPARSYNKQQLSALYSNIISGLRQPIRIPEVISTYGVSVPLVRNAFHAIARLVNSKVPLTPNAIRQRYFS